MTSSMNNFVRHVSDLSEDRITLRKKAAEEILRHFSSASSSSSSVNSVNSGSVSSSSTSGSGFISKISSSTWKELYDNTLLYLRKETDKLLQNEATPIAATATPTSSSSAAASLKASKAAKATARGEDTRRTAATFFKSVFRRIILHSGASVNPSRIVGDFCSILDVDKDSDLYLRRTFGADFVKMLILVLENEDNCRKMGGHLIQGLFHSTRDVIKDPPKDLDFASGIYLLYKVVRVGVQYSDLSKMSEELFKFIMNIVKNVNLGIP